VDIAGRGAAQGGNLQRFVPSPDNFADFVELTGNVMEFLMGNKMQIIEESIVKTEFFQGQVDLFQEDFFARFGAVVRLQCFYCQNFSF